VERSAGGRIHTQKQRMLLVSDSKRETLTVEYFRHCFKPKEVVSFVEMEGFSDDWIDLKMTDDDLRIVQALIMVAPKANPPIRGTGGLRKLRFITGAKTGKRKEIRICYAYFQEFEMVLLVVAYAKNERDNIPPADKRFIREMLRREKIALSRGPRH
jgi:hypothetical protein